MNRCLLEYATVFLIKNKFKLVILAFYFDLVPPFYFLKWNRVFSTVTPVFREPRQYVKYLLLREACTNLQIKTFPLMELWYTIPIHGGSEFQNNNIKKNLPHIYSFWNCLSRNLLIIRLIIITLFIIITLIIAERFTKNSQNSISLFINITL